MKIALEKTNFIIAIIVLIFIAGGGIYSYVNLYKHNSALEKQVTELEKNTEELKGNLSSTEKEKLSLLSALKDEQNLSTSLNIQLGNVSQTVDKLTKLATTDKELLQKYSNVYFLSENYIPSNLILLNEKYVFNKKRPEQIHTNVLVYFVRMMEAMRDEGVPTLVVSAYRSFGTQASLKNNYKVIYGSGANSFSADQGYSEHQLGTAIDLTTEKLGASFESFDKTSAYKWMKENAYMYGFIISYPEKNQYFQFEPWHWKFVGVTLAKKLHDENKNFYDLSQREIDPFLANIFD